MCSTKSLRADGTLPTVPGKGKGSPPGLTEGREAGRQNLLPSHVPVT